MTWNEYQFNFQCTIGAERFCFNASAVDPKEAGKGNMQSKRPARPHATRAAPPVDGDGNFIPMSEWDEADWPEHIHPPREAAESSHSVNEGEE